MHVESGNQTLYLQNLTKNFDAVPPGLVNTLNESFDRFEYIASDQGIETIIFSIDDEEYPKEWES